MTFDEFVAAKDAERAERDRGRVTWRRIDAQGGVGDWSGYGRDGRLVYVGKAITFGGREGNYYYGWRDGRGIPCAVGYARTLAAAKEAAAALTLRDDLAWRAS